MSRPAALLRLLLAAAAGFAVVWAARAWTRRAPSAPPRPPAARLRSLPPFPAPPLSLRQVAFNGTPSVVATYRLEDPPERVLEDLAARLAARGLEGREVGRGLPALATGDRGAWASGRLFTVERTGGGGRLAWREAAEPSLVVEACLRPEGKGTSALWSERSQRGWIPDGGEAPGRDLEGVGRPEGWRRLFCIDAGESLLLCYASAQPPAEASAAYAGRLEGAGWRRIAGGGAATYALARGRCVLSAEAAAEGAQISVVAVRGNP